MAPTSLGRAGTRSRPGNQTHGQKTRKHGQNGAQSRGLRPWREAGVLLYMDIGRARHADPHRIPCVAETMEITVVRELRLARLARWGVLVASMLAAVACREVERPSTAAGAQPGSPETVVTAPTSRPGARSDAAVLPPRGDSTADDAGASGRSSPESARTPDPPESSHPPPAPAEAPDKKPPDGPGHHPPKSSRCLPRSEGSYTDGRCYYRTAREACEANGCWPNCRWTLSIPMRIYCIDE